MSLRGTEGVIYIKRKIKPSVIIFCVIFCVVAIAVLIGVNLLINASKNTETATQDEITSAVMTTDYIDKDVREESELYSNPISEPDTTVSNTTSPKETTKSTEKAASSDKSSNHSEESRVSNSFSSESSLGDINSQSHYAERGSSHTNSYNYNSQQKRSQSSNYSSQKSSSANSKSSNSSSKTSSSSKAPQSSAQPKPTQAVPKPTQAQNNIHLSYSYITVSQGDVVFLSLIGASSGVSWSVSNSSVLVNYGGGGNQCSFKAVSKGTAVVTANYNGTSYYCTVKVN